MGSLAVDFWEDGAMGSLMEWVVVAGCQVEGVVDSLMAKVVGLLANELAGFHVVGVGLYSGGGDGLFWWRGGGGGGGQLALS